MQATVAALDSADLSSLIAFKVIVARADREGWIAQHELLEGVRAEYNHWYSSGAPSETGGAASDAPSLDSALCYLDEHVLPRLAGAGLIESPLNGNDLHDSEAPVGAWTGIRLRRPIADGLPDGRDWLLERLDERIGLVMGETHPERPLPEAETGGEATAPATGIAAPTDGHLAWTRRNGGSVLSARGLVKVYRKRRVVNEVDVQVAEGEIVGLLGPNGAGKTTTFYMMVGLIAPDRGSVHLGSETLTSVPMYKRARKGIGYLAQEPSIFRKLTVEENVLAILQMRGIPRREQKQRLDELLDELGIKHLRSSKAYALSGGERRRLEITRALVGEPKFMLLDEPFAGVDPIAVHDIQQIVSDLRRRGIGVLISDHNVEQTLDIVDRAYIMYDGRVRVSGTVSELVWNDEAAEIYLGPTLTARMRQRYTHPE
jgi:lipopolysaccharide export system ATP-binding protein